MQAISCGSSYFGRQVHLPHPRFLFLLRLHQNPRPTHPPGNLPLLLKHCHCFDVAMPNVVITAIIGSMAFIAGYARRRSHC